METKIDGDIMDSSPPSLSSSSSSHGRARPPSPPPPPPPSSSNKRQRRSAGPTMPQSDEDVLREAGVSDFDRYAVKPGMALLPDLFL